MEYYLECCYFFIRVNVVIVIVIVVRIFVIMLARMGMNLFTIWNDILVSPVGSIIIIFLIILIHFMS